MTHRHNGTNTKEKELDLLAQRKFRAKCRFRAIVRLVIAHSFWLQDEDLHNADIKNVKRRVAHAVRVKSKGKQWLTLTDKALLNKPAHERTEQEQKYIYRIIGGLKCFKKYPDHVKRKLAAATYFKYYGPGRVIVRQHQEAHATYFIVTGDVIISQLVYDELLQRHVSVDIGRMSAGDMFGEVSLLHNIPRTATCTTSGHCEFLALLKEDFKSILQASVQKQWEKVIDAMSRFTYFDNLDQVAHREACIVAKLKSYKPNDIIFGDGAGVPNFVYFVISGRCQMIELLQALVKQHNGQTSYTLYDPYVREDSDQDLELKYFKTYEKNEQDSNNKTSVGSIGSKRSLLSKKNLSIEQKSVLERELAMKQNLPTVSKRRSSTTSEGIHSKKLSIASSHKTRKLGVLKTDEKLYEPENKTLNPNELTKVKSSGYFNNPNRTVRLSLEHEENPLQNLQTYFMQVCIMNPGSIFGLGENMRDRRIVALTHVNCMLLPKVWLLQRNPANIWSRIQHFLEMKIPTKKQLFKEFVSQRRWQKYRDEVVADVTSRLNTVNWTTRHDVPYSIRFDEITDP